MAETDIGMVETGPKHARRKRQSLVRTGGERKPTPRKFALTSLRGVRRELARTYWEARGGSLSMTDASRLSFILVSLGKIIEASDIEARVRQLEQESYDHE